jgi:hypothetical protein
MLNLSFNWMNIFNFYLKKIFEVVKQEDAREESYYPALERMLNEFALSIDKKNIHITVLPKKTDAGNPDFRVWDGKQRIVGYIEAKTPDKNLIDVEKTEQIKRYKSTFKNFILTNFLEFRLYRNDVLIDYVKISDFVLLDGLKRRLTIIVENEEKFKKFLEKFFSFSFPSINKPVDLAIELAKRTRFLRDEVIYETLQEEEKNGLKNILGFYEAFQKYLIRGLSKVEFADLYSQTITYGLFASRIRCQGEFNRKIAVYDIPETIGILKDIFRYISSVDLPQQMEWVVDDICEVLKNVDDTIFSNYQNGEDPIYHFYETFLAEYNPEERERRGVYYTPNQVVSYIVRSLHLILKEKFSLENGLAEENVTILDPAGGTLTFLAEAIRQAVNEFISKYGEGGKEEFIREHIIKNFYAFEVMVAPYTMGHLKISYLLDELDFKLQKDERIKFYLTNTLELEEIEQTALPGMASLADESRKAGEVKKGIPIFVILGNPPYSGISLNVGEWITNLIEDYKYVDRKHFGERKHWLQDDYVKFIRFAEWKINQLGKGVIGYITNHSYLDNPTFRGMRQNLMNNFDEIYILDLHGNSLKKEKCPDGSKDENVFDIRQGVAISFFIKYNNDKKDCKIYHSEIWGLREKKYDFLVSNDINTTIWNNIHPHSPFYFFILREEKEEEQYNKFWKITDIFPITVTGIVTARDKFVIDFDIKELKNRINVFRNLSINDDTIIKNYKIKDTRGWKINKARKELFNDNDWETYFKKILYRPFDVREIYYTPKMVDWPRPEVMQHMMKENLALLTMRQVSLDEDYSHFLVTEHIVDNRTFLSSRGILQFFPLYIYKKTQKIPNISSRFLILLKDNYKENIQAEDILNYVYAVFYSTIYRLKYVQQIKIDFPRVPLTKNYELFLNISKLGKKLIELHLLKSIELNNSITRFQGEGNNNIENISYNEREENIYINKTQYFEGIKKDIWDYHIGGYQISEKWLKDRKYRRLLLDDIKIYCKIITSIKITIDMQEKIDELFQNIESDIIEFKENSSINLEKFTK